MTKETIYELLMYNTNHMNNAPHVIIKSVSYELCDFLMNSMSFFFTDNQYKTFKLMILDDDGNVIRSEKTML